jgi:hypothetical protein
MQAATVGKWPIEYPQHAIRSRTLESAINMSVQTFMILLIVVLLIYEIA